MFALCLRGRYFIKMKFKEFSLRALTFEDLEEVKLFGDQWIGSGYFSLEELGELYKASLGTQGSVSFLAFKDSELVGIRISLAPNQWDHLVSKGLSSEKWRITKEELGYFKSLFIAQNSQGVGLGKKLSQLSEEMLTLSGAKGILCHSWLESPKNSSLRYLESFGFEKVKEHPQYWYEVDYHCTRCGPQRCKCSAAEMIKYLESSS